MAGEPRRTVEPSYARQLAQSIRELKSAVSRLERGANLRNSSISGGEGQKVYDDAGQLRLSIDTSGAVTAYGPDEAPVARYGRLVDTDADEYGVEILVGSGWVRLGYQVVGWDQIAKPAAYDVASQKWDPTPHTHPGGDVTSPVANATNAVNATNASEATHAAQADGSQYGWTNTVAGTEFYQLWVGNDGGFHLGRNVSSIKYKENVKDAALDPQAVLKLRPVVYDRKPTTQSPVGVDGEPVEGPDQQFPGAKGELGLIAEEAAPLIPGAITRFNGEIDGLRYELLPVYMIPLLQQQQARIDALEAAVRKLGGII